MPGISLDIPLLLDYQIPVSPTATWNWPNFSALNLWELLPLIADVAYTWADTVDDPVSLTISFVCTTPIAIRERQISFGVYKYAETTFNIDPGVWNAAVDAASASHIYPKSRDTLVDKKGLTWRVTRAVAPPENGSVWGLVCVRLIIESVLCDTISILPPENHTDTYVSPITLPGAAVEPEIDMPCRIQLTRQALEDFQGIQFMRNYYSVYVAALDDNLEIGSLVKATSGDHTDQIFRVVSTDNIEQLEELEMITCTIDPVP